MEINQNRIERLTQYVREVANHNSNIQSYQAVEEDILSVNPREVFKIFHFLLEEGMAMDKILGFLDRIIHAFYQSLQKYKVDLVEDSFLDHLRQENQALIDRLEQIKTYLKTSPVDVDALKKRFEELQIFNQHYIKKENILFPYLEKMQPEFNGLSIMWAYHDQCRKQLKAVLHSLQEYQENPQKFNQAVGRYFFSAYGLIDKEELILFPIAHQLCSEELLLDMRAQSFEFGFCFIDPPQVNILPSKKEDYNDWIFQSETGILTYEQLSLLLDFLPVECTLIDEHNKVRFFNRPNQRVFPRSKAIIGRDVRNCHPSDSVSKVDEIIDAFRKNERDVATFWFTMRNKRIFVQYFALRNQQGAYKGTLEVSQDISEIQLLEGERRLLDWS